MTGSSGAARRRQSHVHAPNRKADMFSKPSFPLARLHELLPWEWKRLRQAEKPASQLAA